jgi:hypothetical protein
MFSEEDATHHHIPWHQGDGDHHQIEHVLHTLGQTFTIKDLGWLDIFLSIEASYTSDVMILGQHKYALDLFHRANMESYCVVSTPISTSDKLYRDLGDRFTQDVAFLHHSLVGALLYLTLTWSDLSFVVNKVCQFLAPPTNVDYKAVKRIIRYIKGNFSTSLLNQKAPSTILNILYRCWLDGMSRHSTSGFAIFLGPNLISWSSHKHPTVSCSALVQNQPLELMAQLRQYGSNPCLRSSVFISSNHLLYGVIIWGPVTCPPIRCSMPVPSTSSWIFISWGRRLLGCSRCLIYCIWWSACQCLHQASYSLAA